MATTHLLKRQGYTSQNLSSGTVVDYWGYAVRVLPCENDPLSCEYLDIVYRSHEVGMIYSGALWATLGGLLLLYAFGRPLWARPRAAQTLPFSSGESQRPTGSSTISRYVRSFGAARRYYFLPESMRLVFGRVTRLQIIVLLILTAYLTIFSFAGITYSWWRTPVKGYDNLYQIRSSLGPWSDRIGVLAYALTPFSVLLATRESLLSQLTGIPYQSFNFLHRWLGYIIFVQSVLHTIGWTLIEVVYYQPQPQVAKNWIKQLYMIWGCIAMILLFILFILSTPWAIRRTGYEFFRKSHYILAITYVGACWGHWQPLKAFMAPALALWFADRLIRFARSALIHYQYLPSGSMGFQTSKANIICFEDPLNGDVIRLDIDQPQKPWQIGQHFYLCFTQLSIWQSHPFTPCSVPVEDSAGNVRHSYIIRAKKGETSKLVGLASSNATAQTKTTTTPVVMQGPYGENLVEHLCPDVNVIAIAGGTGITYVLPVLLWLVQQNPSVDRSIMLIWVVRQRRDMEWVRPELDILLAAVKTHGVEIRISSSREPSEGVVEENKGVIVKEGNVSSSASSDTSGRPEVDIGAKGRPDLAVELSSFVSGNIRGRTAVFASGPGEMITDARTAVAGLNRPKEVFRGKERFDVDLSCDDRLDW